METKKGQFLELVLVYIAVILIAIFVPSWVSLGKNIPTKMLLMLLPFVMMTGLIFLILIIQKRPILKTLGFQKDSIGKQLCISIGIFAITSFLFVIAPLLLGLDKHDVLSYKVTKPSIFVFYIVYFMIFVGMGEEMVYRGYMFSKIKVLSNSGLGGAIISSILFGLWHYPVGHNILQVLMASIIGLIFGLSRLKIKNCSTLSVGIAHGLHDTLILILSSILL